MDKIHIDLMTEINNILNDDIREVAIKLITDIEKNTNDDRIKTNIKREVETIGKRVK